MEAQHATFVVRVSRDDTGGIHGVVICVRTGARTLFAGVDEAGAVLGRAIERETRRPADQFGDRTV